jgi:hypothetical protein
MRRFVLGNGRSRLNIKPEELRPYGYIYGCNALYREFEPDYLIAVDPKMIFEIESKGWQLTHQVWTNINSKYKKFKNFNYFQPSLGWSSGPTALNFATQHGASEIYILGFDYVGMPSGLVNNIYSGTENYKKSDDTATYYGNWRRQTDQVIRSNPNIKYFRVVEENFFDPEWNYKNFSHITYNSFTESLKNFNKIR